MNTLFKSINITQRVVLNSTTTFNKNSCRLYSTIVSRSSPLLNNNRLTLNRSAAETTTTTTITSNNTTNNGGGLKDFFEHVYTKGTYPVSGKSWEARDLRGKSFEDLHKLWFVLLKERNKVMTEQELAKNHKLVNPLRLKKIRKSMAAIKVVLGERDRLRKQLYILTKCPESERNQVQKEVERLTKLVGAVSLTPGLRDLEQLQDTLKVDESLESSIDNLQSTN
ncbi:hypothetical protein PPL_07986 [Heterostelium album PN500]|uniref:Large ribosomal subunit protein uL29m n=1 Tax=Heterostelium pallidum (strain ATCC 26659 / Pp 5 / PN500) TaxID=670386 RepID=D3BHI4_HETP5|nr:hypothetical protein PPL_07986 [Heterostelium album PN500]EFA79161.1 hypothetical protein PPL_07986 [Heterostelium album PN500]|eukprot:XP_020431283.1 hypothetical protein PPL_07986 [Heterostelium album PN500]